MFHPYHNFTYRGFVDALREQVELKNVRPTTDGELTLYCYSEKCVYERQWNPITEITRGIVFDHAAEQLVALPFPKFFNIGERDGLVIPAERFQTYEKLDGSLIIAFCWNGQWRTATKGALHSEQAKWARQWLLGRDLSQLAPDTTYLFEAIYPENRIVIRYQEQGLVLLGAYNRETGAELALDSDHLLAVCASLHCRTPNVYAFDHVDHLLQAAQGLAADNEGWVVKFPSGLRLKVKGDEYRRLHRIISGITPLNLWESLRSGEAPQEMKKAIPEEFWGDFDRIVGLLEPQVEALKAQIRDLHQQTAHLSNKEIGLATDVPADLKSFLFNLRKKPDCLDRHGKELERLYDRVRPAGNRLVGYVPSSAMERVLDR